MLRPIDTPLTTQDTESCEVADPLQVIVDEHALQFELCNLLEALADSLPYDLDKNLVQVAVSILSNSWPKHLELEEKCLFPLLRQRASDDTRVHGVLERLEIEHDDDEDRADELVSALRAYLDVGALRNPESLGYMLRGFFEAQRRHIGWENDVVLPVAREVLTESDLTRMQNWIIASDHPRCAKRSIVEIRNAQKHGSICDDCPERPTRKNS